MTKGAGLTEHFQPGTLVCLKESYRRRLEVKHPCGVVTARNLGYIKVKLHSRQDESEWYAPSWWVVITRCDCDEGL